MTLRKLALRPDSDGYSDSEGEDVIRVELEGGVGRYRRDKIGSSLRVNVRWTLNRTQYQYWRAFFVTQTQKGSLPFLCDLVGEDGLGPAEHVCSFIPGSVGKPGQSGLTYVQQATLEVKPLAHDAETDEDIMVAFEVLGETSSDVFLALERLCLVIAPEAIGAE